MSVRNSAVIKILRKSPGEDVYRVELFLSDEKGELPETPSATSGMPESFDEEKLSGGLSVRTIMELLDAHEHAPAPDDSNIRMQIGAVLFRKLFTPEIERNWEERKRKTGGMLTMLDIEPPELWGLPWELMYRPPALPRQPLQPFLDIVSPMVRRQMIPESPRPCCGRPIRVLIVIGCEEEDGTIQWSEEVQGIEDAFRHLHYAVDYRKLKRPPTKDVLLDTIRDFRPDIFHFIGHGRSGGEHGGLSFYSDADGYSWSWNAIDIATDLQAIAPRLVVVNACSSANISVQRGLWSVSQSFFAVGTDAVIGMQGDISGIAAAAFGRKLYAALSSGKTLDVACAEARLAIKSSRNGDFGWSDWYLPNLMLAAPVENVIPPYFGVSPELAARISSREFKEHCLSFIDRDKQRRKIWNEFLYPPEQRKKHLLIIRGDKGVGKTAVAHWSLHACLIDGHQVRYRDLKGASKLDFIDTLRRVMIGDPSEQYQTRQPLDPAAFGAFKQLLPDDDDLASVSETFIDEIFETYLEALRTVAATAGQPLVIAFDHLGSTSGGIIADDFKKYIAPRLIAPLIASELPVANNARIRFIIAVTEQEYHDFGLERFEDDAIVVDVPAFRKEDFPQFCYNYLRLLGYDHSNSLETANGVKVTIKGPAWNPTSLVKVKALMEENHG